MRILLALTFLSMMFVAYAQNILDPGSWFHDNAAIFSVAALIASYVTKIFTALGKDWFNTDGSSTQWLSAGVAVLIGGIGGFFGLGQFAEMSGLTGVFNAAILVVIAFLTSNGMAKSERQVAASAARSIGEEIEEHTVAALRRVENE